MQRRELLVLVASLAGWLPLRAFSQQVKRQRKLIVWYASGLPLMPNRFFTALLDGLRDLGLVEGRDFDVDYRAANNSAELMPILADEVVGLQPDLIVAGAADAALEAKKRTATIPIISGALADAIHLGLVESYARPGRNVTGITPYVPDLPAKQMQIVQELIPGAKKVGLLGNLNDVKAVPQHEELVEAARKLEIKVVSPEIRTVEDIEPAIRDFKTANVDAVIVLQTTLTLSQRQRLPKLFAEYQLPAVYGYREHVEEGGLLSYGVNLSWCWRHLATQAHKILHGASPATLPVEFPPKILMVINLGAARALGLSVPPLVLARADEVID
jgi:putative tryptophan/tyrosine transport system substrate-binding protein